MNTCDKLKNTSMIYLDCARGRRVRELSEFWLDSEVFDKVSTMPLICAKLGGSSSDDERPAGACCFSVRLAIPLLNVNVQFNYDIL